MHADLEMELKVHIAQDEESGAWYIAESDIPGLRLEASSADELIRKVEEVATDLIELNLAEVLASKAGQQTRKVQPSAAKPSSRYDCPERPRALIRPVFDSPLAVAC
jgi:hypothetical protein